MLSTKTVVKLKNKNNAIRKRNQRNGKAKIQ